MDAVGESLRLQAVACRHLGSLQYADLLEGVSSNYDVGGVMREVLHGVSERPIHDAVPLRLLAAVHRIALRGDAPRLAARYLSCGGDGTAVDIGDFLDVVTRHRPEVVGALAEQVQTNETGRSVVLVAIAHWLPSIGIDEFDLLELGSSAGLNLLFDRLGSRIPDEWFEHPDIARRPARCISRRGCDLAPLDVTDPVAALRLESFVWPDQGERLERLRAAIAIARQHPPVVERASAEVFLHSALATDAPRSRVVFHSIVWPYLGEQVQRALVQVLSEAGTRADPSAPLVWARMEPAGEVADIRVTVYDGETITSVVLAEVGYHGGDLRLVLRAVGDPLVGDREV